MAISIHALRGEGDQIQPQGKETGQGISIHALRGEGDKHVQTVDSTSTNFYPRPPWGGRRSLSAAIWGMSKFLSTPSVGRATLISRAWKRLVQNFYPRPPWGGRPQYTINSAPSNGISIHALRGEGDWVTVKQKTHFSNFYPRPPWGGRRPMCQWRRSLKIFLSTPSVGRATSTLLGYYIRYCISIHALRGEGDLRYLRVVPLTPLFLSTPSVGRATVRPSQLLGDLDISIHALRGEGDLKTLGIQTQDANGFLSTPSVGRATFTEESVY